jgi:hypothetical protein
MTVELGTNDVFEPMGALEDSVTAGTVYGNMQWVCHTFLTAKPTLRIVLVAVQYNGNASAVSLGGIQAQKRLTVISWEYL